MPGVPIVLNIAVALAVALLFIPVDRALAGRAGVAAPGTTAFIRNLVLVLLVVFAIDLMHAVWPR